MGLVLAGWGVYRWVFPADERVIRRRLQEAAEAAGIPQTENPLARLAAGRRLAAYCTPEVEVLLSLPGVSQRSLRGRAELCEAVGAARVSGQSLRVTLLDVAVEVDPDRRGAAAQVIVRASLSDVEDPAVQEFRLRLERRGRDWLIARVEPVKGFGM